MTNIYDIIKQIKDFLLAHPLVNTVTFGDISEVDLNKTTIFPLSHMLLGNVQITEHAMRITISMLFMDIVDHSKDFNSNDFGYRQDDSDLIDIYNTQLQIANSLIQDLKRGELYRSQYQLADQPILEPFKDRFENMLAGWSADITIDIPSDYSVC